MQRKLFSALLVLLGVFVVMAPSLVFAETSLAQLAQCSGPDCSACNVVYMANGLIKWLIGIAVLLFAVLLAIAGVKLVTSGGNHHALDEAKNSFVNAIIGLIIILSAWLIVDTIIRGLVGHDGKLADTGSATGWLYWSEVTCQKQVEPDAYKAWESQLATYWPGDPSGGFSNSQVLSVNSCAATPSGNVDCAALEQACKTAGNYPMVDTTNPVDHKVNCVKVVAGDPAPIAGSGSAGCSGGACVALTIPCSAQGCSIAPDMVSRLAAMHSAAGVSGARVTEAMPPSRVHKNACHQNGTCIDYSKAGGMSASEVVSVISAAQRNGLRPVYEVQTQSQKDALVSAGAPSGSVMVLGNWISAPHFSIYGN